VLGAVAAGIWLRRRQPSPPLLRERSGEQPPPVPPAPGPAPPVRPRLPSRRFQRAGQGRFQRPAARRRIDIVTIVDDLLGVPS
jgi:hypothetical protein